MAIEASSISLVLIEVPWPWAGQRVGLQVRSAAEEKVTESYGGPVRSLQAASCRKLSAAVKQLSSASSQPQSLTR